MPVHTLHETSAVPGSARPHRWARSRPSSCFSACAIAAFRAASRTGFSRGLLGELPLTLRPIVCVLEQRDREAALLCVREMEAALGAPELPDVTCPNCGDTSPGNFEERWKCRTELDP